MRLMRDRLLGLPIIYKVLVANTAILVVGAVGGTWLTIGIARNSPAVEHYELLAAFAAVGVFVSVVVNYLVLRAALAPLTALAAAVSEVRNGNVDARAPRSAFTDPA